jgi:hypothetical protein
MGGDRRQAERAGDRELSLASLLFTALYEDQSAAGRKYRRERDQLLRKYDRLVRCLVSYPIRGEMCKGPAVLEHVHDYLINASLPRYHWYPRPAPLTNDALHSFLAEYRRRQDVADAASEACCERFNERGEDDWDAGIQAMKTRRIPRLLAGVRTARKWPSSNKG